MFGKSKELAEIKARLAKMDASIERLSELVATATAKPRGVELLKSLGVTPERFLQRYFQDAPYGAFYAALNGGAESLRGGPAALGLQSGLCRQIHFSTDEFRYWIGALGGTPSMHRKHSISGRRSRNHGRNSGGVYRQVQKIFQNESSRSVSENKGDIRWQQAKRETRNTGTGSSR